MIRFHPSPTRSNNGDKESLLSQETILVLPSICIGNVAQLAMDLVVFNYPCKRVGSLSHPLLNAVCGVNALDEDQERNVDTLREPSLSLEGGSYLC